MNALRALWTALWTEAGALRPADCAGRALLDPAPEMRLAPAQTIAGPRCPCGAPGTVPVRAGFDNYTVCEQHAPQLATV